MNLFDSVSQLNRARTTLVERWLNQLRYRVTSPQFIISILLLVVLAYLVLVPLYGLIDRTLIWEESDARISREMEVGQLTLFHWKNILSGRFAKKFFFEPLVHTLITGSIAAVVALMVGRSPLWLH
jgi:ABC-type maltose transport system permease subunit